MIDAINNAMIQPAAPQPGDSAPKLRASEGLFAGQYDRARAEKGTVQDQIKEQARLLVSTTFIMPMFEQLRSDPLATNLVHGGIGESAFQQQFDQIMADRIASGANFDLVDSVANYFGRMMGQEQPGEASKEESQAVTPELDING